MLTSPPFRHPEEPANAGVSKDAMAGRDRMGETISIKSVAADGFAFPAYHAAPTGERKGGVIVIQEIFGIDEHVKRDVDRWASLGFEAVAPALYERREPGFHAAHSEE